MWWTDWIVVRIRAFGGALINPITNHESSPAPFPPVHLDKRGSIVVKHFGPPKFNIIQYVNELNFVVERHFNKTLCANSESKKQKPKMADH